MKVYEGHSQFADLLKNSEDNLSSLLSLFKNTLIFIFDARGRFTFGQGDSTIRLHLDSDHFLGKSVRDLFPVSVSAPFKEAFNKNLHGEVAEFSYKLVTEAHTGWFKAICSPVFRDGVFDGSLAVVREVTKEKESKEALQRSEENFRTLVEMATVAIVIITEGKLAYANPVTCELSGYTCEELLSKNFIDFIAPSERQRVMQIHSSRASGDDAPDSYETKVVRQDGSILDVEICLRTIEYQNTASVQALLQDISIKKQLELERLSIQETLQKRVTERTSELEKYREHLQEIVDERTTRLRNTVSLLRIEIEERVIAEERAEHLKQILRAIRSINLLITKETDTQVLIDSACMNLVEARGYKDAWIFLVNQDGSYMTASEARYGENLEPLKDNLMLGHYTPCINKSLSINKPWISDLARSICSDCSLKHDSDKPRHIMACRLECRERVFGVLTVTSLGSVPPDSEEVGLFTEVCDDIAFALDSIEHEKARKLAAKALSESEDRYKALFENSGMAILFMEEDMILDCNARAEEIFRCSKQYLTGMKPCELSPEKQPDGRLSLEKSKERIQAAIKDKPQFFQWVHTRVSGEEFPAEISLNAVRTGGKNYIQAIVNDITSREEAENALRKSERNYRTLSDNVPVGLFRSDPAGKGTLLAVNPMMATMFGYDSQHELLQKSSEVLYINVESRLSFLSELNSSGVVENYETQMHRRDGSWFWASISARFFTQDDESQSCLIDGIITDISESKLHEENLRRSLDSFKEAIEGTVSAMSLLVEMKDPYTSGHQKGVALLACAIGREMGLDDDTIDCLRIASTLHDLGKLNVPLEILNKPGPLNEFEMDFLKTHPGAGYDILKAVEFPWPIAEVIHQHHERQDGSGYPRGLKGDEIMIEASIIAVADVVEAVASRRPYRASRGIDVALDVVREGYGTFFHPEVVDICLKLFNEKGFTLIDHDMKSVKTDFTL
ncbi:MAG: PAS domain S-box protein [Candidatus Sabulitectum sp.]|nr:PAS domain S-box protein [Candidatus Sabulitectum sp.]